MNLDQLQIISTIAELGSLTGASKKLLRSPSAISLNLKNLEEEWGIQIFDRSEYRLKLTRDGEDVLIRIKKILSEVNSLNEHVKSLNEGPEASIKICIHKVFPFEEIEQILQSLKEKFPNTLVYISVKDKNEPNDLLHNNDVDIAISLAPLMTSEKFEYKPIYNLNLVPVAAPSLIRNKQVPKEELVSLTQIITGEYKKGDIGTAGIQEGNSKWSVTDLATKKRLILRGLGYGMLPKYQISNELKNKTLIEIKSLKKRSYQFVVAINNEATIGPVKNFLWNSLNKK